MKAGSNVATLIERYFTERLRRQRNVSANTIASYRDTFRLLFTFAQARVRKAPSALALGDLDVPFISAFLADLETKRGVSVKTRKRSVMVPTSSITLSRRALRASRKSSGQSACLDDRGRADERSIRPQYRAIRCRCRD